MAIITNSTIAAGGAAQDILAAQHNYMALVFVNESSNLMRVNIGADATVSLGEKVAAGSAATFNNILGKRMSVYGVTTADVFSFREATG